MARADSEHMREERRAQLLAAAIPLFAWNGFSQTTVSEVARQAGVSHGTVFVYFPTKEALFHAAVLEPLKAFERDFQVPAGDEVAAGERIRQLVTAQVALFARQGHYLRLTQYVLGQRDRFPELATELFAFANRARDQIVPALRAGQAQGSIVAADPVMLFWSYFSYLSGLGLIITDPPEDPSWHELTRSALRIFGLS